MAFGQQGLTDPWGGTPTAVPGSPTMIDPLDYLRNQQGVAAGGGAPGMGTGGLGAPNIPTGPGNQNQANFFNETYWKNPEAAIANIFQTMTGKPVNLNSSFYSDISGLAPGLNWMELLNSGVTGGIGNWMGDLNQWANRGLGNAQQGAFGTGSLNRAIQALMGGGSASDPETQWYLDALQPNDIASAMVQMLQSAGYGQVAPQLIQGLANHMQNLVANYNGQSGNMNNPNMSDAMQFTNFLKQNGGDVLNYFNRLGL